MTMKQKLVVILGPTASGKTALAHYLASVFRGELINADSRQVYRKMDIGTAKATNNLQPTTYNAKMHLIDIKNPDERFTVADYKKLAIQSINEVIERKKLPILVGGTGLYIKAIVENLEIPAIPVQEDLRAQLEKKTAEELFLQLQRLDPQAASRIDRYNKRRLARALEVIIVNGVFQAVKGEKIFDVLQIGIAVEKEELSSRIEKRVEEMLNQGLEKEVRALVKKYRWTTVLATTIGYKEWKSLFDEEETIEQVKEEIIKNTQRYVKKQLTWFRADKTIHWIKQKNEAQRLVQKFLESS